jgi:hypothetical protein
MIMKYKLIAVLLLFIGINACASLTPTEYHNDREQMKGPGLFSGETGEFTIEVKKTEE